MSIEAVTVSNQNGHLPPTLLDPPRLLCCSARDNIQVIDRPFSQRAVSNSCPASGQCTTSGRGLKGTGENGRDKEKE